MSFRSCIRAIVPLALLVAVTAGTVGVASAAPAGAPARTGVNLLATKGMSIQSSPQALAGIQCFVATIIPKKDGGQMSGFSSVTCSSPVRLIEIRTAILDQANNIVADTGVKPTSNTNRVENTASAPCRTGLYRTAAAVFVEFGSGDPPTAQGVFASDFAGVVC